MIEKIIELKNAGGANEKLEILKKYQDDNDFCVFLYYALNPLLSYNLSETTLKDASNAEDMPLMFFNDIFECCEFLSRLRGVDDATVRQVKTMLYYHCTQEERDVYIKLLAKTLRLGVTAKTVNKAIPNLIPEWEVQQAYPIDKYPIRDGVEFWLTQKLNGVRATFYNGRLVARSGQYYKGLDDIVERISSVASRYGVVFDGELTLSDTYSKELALSDNESFRQATGIINSDTENKNQICYTIFDVISVKDFESDDPVMTYRDRRRMLDSMRCEVDSACVHILPVLYHGTDQSMIWKLLDRMVAEDKEGLMLNTDVPYHRKRHRGILKVKQFYTMDLPILRCEEGSGRLSGRLGAFVLDFHGNEVKVGSGFSDEQRDTFWKQRKELCGMLCEVKYKEVSSDKHTSLESLQFPVFIRVRDDKCDISYG